jgi:hypothetical protein
VAGTLTVPALYLLVRRLFARDGQSVAVFSSLALAVSYWHIHFSHYGIRVILMPLLLCVVFGLFWIGMHGTKRRRKLLAVLASGALAGLSVWTNPTGRFTPFVAGAYVLWLLWRYPERRRLRLDSPLGGLLLFGTAAFVVFLPLGIEFWRHPEFFTGHASEVSIFAERVTGGGSPWPLLFNNILRVLGMFSFDGDLEWAHGIADRPVFDWFLAIPFYIGAVIWVLRLLGKSKSQPDPDRDSLALFTAWAAVMLAPSVLSEAAPNYSRTLPAIPAVMLAAGLGLSWLAALPRLRPSRFPGNVRFLSSAWGVVLAGLLVTASTAITFNDYFVRFPAFREVYYIFDADKVDALAWMEAQADAGSAVYLSPLWSTHSTVAFLRSGRIESLDATDALVLPAGTGAVYAFPAEQRDHAEDVADRLDAPVELIGDKYGRPMLAAVRIDAEQSAQWPEDLYPEQVPQPHGEARFDDAPTLLGVNVRPNGLDLWLFWRADAETNRDLTSFVHLVDAEGRRLGQIDKTPGDGTYHTQHWTQGDRVIQRYRPQLLDACAGGERVQVVTGWYEYAADNARRPRADGEGDSAVAGAYALPFYSMPAETFQPAFTQDVPLALWDLRLRGHTVHGLNEQGRAQPGSQLMVELVLAGTERHGDFDMAFSLRPEDRPDAAPIRLWVGQVAPRVTWDEEELLCRRLQVELPADLSPGRYLMYLKTGDYDQPFGEIVVDEPVL